MSASGNQSDIRLTLRQLANLGLPSSAILPSALAAIRELVGADHVGYFFCDEAGNIANMYTERMLSPAQMVLYQREHYTKQESNFCQAYLQRCTEKNPVSAYSLTVLEKESDYYKQVLAPLGISHFLYAIVRCGGLPVGQLSAYRGANREPFSKTDQQTLGDILHYLERLVNPKMQLTLSETPSPIAETAMAVLTETDTILYADTQWDRLLRMARGGVITPQNAQDEVEQLPQFIASVLALIRHSNAIGHTVKTEWGTFRFRLLALSGQAGNAQALSISRQADELVFVAEAVARLKLPVQQREVAVYLTQNKSNMQIAEKLGISINTVNYHVKALFQRLNIHDRSEVLSAITKAVDS